MPQRVPFAKPLGGLVTHARSLLFPENLYYITSRDSGTHGGVNFGVGPLANSSPKNIQRHMNKGGGGGRHRT